MRLFLTQPVAKTEHESLAWGECSEGISQLLRRQARADDLKRICCLRIGDGFGERLAVIEQRRFQTDGRAQQLTETVQAIWVKPHLVGQFRVRRGSTKLTHEPRLGAPHGLQ